MPRPPPPPHTPHIPSSPRRLTVLNLELASGEIRAPLVRPSPAVPLPGADVVRRATEEVLNAAEADPRLDVVVQRVGEGYERHSKLVEESQRGEPGGGREIVAEDLGVEQEGDEADEGRGGLHRHHKAPVINGVLKKKGVCHLPNYVGFTVSAPNCCINEDFRRKESHN